MSLFEKLQFAVCVRKIFVANWVGELVILDLVQLDSFL